MILVPKWSSLLVEPATKLTQIKRRPLIWWQELTKVFLFAPPGFLQQTKRRPAPQVSHNFAVRTSLWQLKQTRLCWPFNSWRSTATPRISTTKLIEFRNCLNPLWQECPRSTGNQKNLNFWKISSKQVSNFTINSRKKTNSTISSSHAWWCA